MTPATISSETSFETRKRIEEQALQHVSTFCPAVQTYANTAQPPLTQPYSVGSIDTISSAKTNPPSFVPKVQINEALCQKCDLISSTPKELLKPIDVLFYEIMKLLESQGTSALTTRELLIKANTEWQHTLEKELLSNAEKSKKASNAFGFFNRISQSIGPATVCMSSFISFAAGVVSPLAISTAALGALFFIDAIFDDAAKKYIASILARGEKEEAKAWLQRIQLFSSIASFCMSCGTTKLNALDIATKVSKTALEGIKTGTEWSKNQSEARNIELESSFQLYQSLSDVLIKKWEQIIHSILEIYEHQHSIEAATNKTCQTLARAIQ